MASLLPHRCYSFERLIAGFPSRLTVDMEYFCSIPDTRNVTQCYSVKTGRVSTIVHRANANRGSGGADSIRRLAHMCSDRFLTKSEILSERVGENLNRTCGFHRQFTFCVFSSRFALTSASTFDHSNPLSEPWGHRTRQRIRGPRPLRPRRRRLAPPSTTSRCARSTGTGSTSSSAGRGRRRGGPP